MKKNNYRHLNNDGVTLIEALIGIGLVSLISMSVYAALFAAANNMSDAKQRVGAVSLANEKMETLRHLSYDKVGTLTGIGPRGPIPVTEETTKNGTRYTVRTDIRYVDDPFDGVAPTDTVNTDYKQAKIMVTWRNNNYTKNVEFFSNFIPHGIETNMGGGTLSVNVTNSAGEIVPNVTVHVESIEDSPDIDVVVTTDETGHLIFPGTPAQHYRITLSKDGYETVRTYPDPPASSFTPKVSDILVIENNLNMIGFIMDKSGDLKIKAVDVADSDGINGISFQLRGGRLIGTDPDTFSTDETIPTSNSSGEDGVIGKNDLSPGVYEVVNLADLSNDQYYYLGCDAVLPIQVDSEMVKEANFLFADKSLDSLVVKVLNENDQIPVASAQVRVVGTDFDQTVVTGVEGIAYFPAVTDPVTPMPPEDYQISVSAEGYYSHDETVTIDNLVVKEVQLNDQ